MVATQLSGYRLMWIFVMFDLPVMTKDQARAATKFREYLLDEGFEKSQFSVYARFCNGKEQFEAYMRRIEAHLPDRGDIHVLTFMDRQYETIVRFSGQRRKRQRKNRTSSRCSSDSRRFRGAGEWRLSLSYQRDRLTSVISDQRSWSSGNGKRSLSV